MGGSTIPPPSTASTYIAVTGMVQKDLSLQVMVCDPFGDSSLDTVALDKLVRAMHRFPNIFFS